MQKAFSWLEEEAIAYTFHNYKTEELSSATIEAWMKKIPLTSLINTKGTTYRKLSDAEKKACNNPTKAVAVILAQPSLVKRPLWDLGRGVFLVGFTDESKERVAKAAKK